MPDNGGGHRPEHCCGKCPPIVGGGYDCTCEGNPNCTGPRPMTSEEKLAATLYLVLTDAHRTYSSTATWHGGVGGQALTRGCAFKDPAPDQGWASYDLPSAPLREWLMEHPNFDVQARAEEMKKELLAILDKD